MILLEVPPKLIIYKSDIFITICQCEKCICNDLLHYAYTYNTSSYTLYNMNLFYINKWFYTNAINYIFLSRMVRLWWVWRSRTLSIIFILEGIINDRVSDRVLCMRSNLSSTTRMTASVKWRSLPFVSCPYYRW